MAKKKKNILESWTALFFLDVKQCMHENSNVLQISAPGLLLAYDKLQKTALKLLQETFIAGSIFFSSIKFSKFFL